MRQSIRLFLVVALAALFAGGWTCGARTGPRLPEPRDIERLAFDRPSPGRGSDVWIMELGGAPSRLTASGHDSFPAFNSGGDKVAYSSDRSAPVSAAFEIGVNGRDETRLFSGPSANRSIADLRWTSDGRMAFTFDDNVWTFISGSLRRVPPDGVHASWPSFGPDALYFSRLTGPGTRQIWRVNLTTGSMSRFSTPDGAVEPAWMADGSAMFYVFEGNIERVNRDGSGTAIVVRGGAQPAPSPNGRRLAFVRGGAVWVAAIDGSGQVAATSGPQDAHPVWAPVVRQP